MRRLFSLILDAIEIFFMVPIVGGGLAAIVYFITPDFFRVTLAKEPVPVTVSRVIDKSAPKFLTLTGRVDYTRVRCRCTRYKDLPRCVPEEYLYPVFDGSSREGVYIKTKTVPEDFIALHPGKVTVTAVSENVSESDRKYHFFLDAGDISKRMRAITDASRRVNINKPGTEDLMRLMSISRDEPAPVNDLVYLNAEYQVYRGISGYFIGIFSIVISLAGAVFIAIYIRTGVGDLRAKYRKPDGRQRGISGGDDR